MESPEVYIPIDRRLAMGQGCDLPDRMQGAALFADISGFTPLSETLAKELGPRRGAEEVTRLLNLVYSALVAEVDRYGGSIISFSGDAITCWLDGDDGLRAATCAAALQEAMRQFVTVQTPSGSVLSLAIKVAVAAGPVRRFRVGDPRVQYIDVLAGVTLDRLASAEHLASKGEIILCPEVAARLQGNLSIREWRQAETPDTRFAVMAGLAHPAEQLPWPTLPCVLPEEQVRPWLVPVIYERLTSGQGQYLAELRPAVALFLRFGGIDYDEDDDAAAKLDDYIRWVQGIVTRYEGIVAQLTIGDKGSYFYGAFGAPLAHDDDPVRGVAAALELKSPPAHLAAITGMQIGISLGRMRTGPYGGLTRRTYGVMGDDVNLAARLMSKAEPRQILVSQRIADAVSSRYALAVVGEVSVKGKQKPVLVSEVLERHLPESHNQTAQFACALIGRDAELEQVERLLAATQSSNGQILRITGAAGIGKSHLAAMVAQRAAELRLRIIQGSCQSITIGTAYAPWRQVLSGLMGLSNEMAGDATADQHNAHLIEQVQVYISSTNRDWLLRLPLLGDLLGLPIPDNATTAAFEPRLRQSALFDLVLEMLRRESQARALLVVLDDVHLMDEASRGLTLALGRAVAAMPLLLALVHRPPQHGNPILTELDALSFHHRIELNELSAEDVAYLIGGRIEGQPSALVSSLVQAETQGNPFFVEELVDTLRSSGDLFRSEQGVWELSERIFSALQRANCLVRREGQWVLAKDAPLAGVDLGLPDSIQGLVLSRIDRLPESPKLTLRVASVVGRSFTLDVVSRAHPLQPDDAALLEQAHTLETHDFTRRDNLQARAYSFKHTVTHDVAYDTLLFSQRQQLHHAVGLALEQLVPAAIVQIAYHTFLAEDWQRSLHYQFDAALQAKKLFANQEGIEHLRKALTCAEQVGAANTSTQRLQIHAALGELLAVTGQYEPALDHSRQALALAATLSDRDAQARACRWIAYVHEFRSEYPLALNWIQQGLQALGSRETVARAELLAIAALIDTRQGNYDRALEQCADCIRIAEKLGDVTSLAFAQNSRAIVSYSRGYSADAIEHFERAAALYRQADNIHGQAMSYNGIGNSYQNMGRWSEAYANLKRARETFLQTGDELHRVFADNNLGEIARNQGRLDEALDYYQAALHTLEQMGGSVYVLGVLHMNLGATLVRRSDISGARQHLRKSQELYAQANSRDFQPELHRHLAEAALVTVDLAEAQSEGQQALDLARELRIQNEEGYALRILGEVDCMKGNLDQAELHLTQSLAILMELGHEYESARSRLSLARVYLSVGRIDEGMAVLQKCIAVFSRLEAQMDLDVALELQKRGLR